MELEQLSGHSEEGEVVKEEKKKKKKKTY